MQRRRQLVSSCRASAGAYRRLRNYVVDIPRNESPGLYWYHPHAHGESEHQLLLQLTGAIVVDTINPYVPTTITIASSSCAISSTASADTILDLQLLINNIRVPIQATTRDGVPLVTQNGHPTWQPVPLKHVYLDRQRASSSS